MPKLIDYPRTSYPGAWEVAEVVDDTGGKSALETCARKLNRKVSGSFKAIVGSAVKFGLLTSKREILTTTTLFRRIKHAYDKQEELLFHREAFLTPPLFMQLCRKFRSRELPVAMLDVLLIREFGVEEINAQGVAKAFTDGARMVGLLDEHNIMADVDHLAAQQPPRREIASPQPTTNNFRQAASNTKENDETSDNAAGNSLLREEIPTEIAKPRAVIQATTAATNAPLTRGNLPLPASRPAPVETTDAIAHLFGLGANANHPPSSTATANQTDLASATTSTSAVTQPGTPTDRAKPITKPASSTEPMPLSSATESEKLLFRLQLTGPGLETTLEVSDADDLLLVRALLDKIERQLKRNQ
ncbi:hypothetical protein HHL22_03570 [Hymenobacter sp. RP-2-7]|uniref:Uncharacterized protein n=1 Tax=Hymenobacter polaris TaxID=2682546 RepID=A0A7Y0ABK8_9BACT|nr:hypothetical protein [Hymenobacter polaris]NML64278.1 hypothetical protein [Hymenobacter polaris]